MYSYSAYGLNFDTEIAFPELVTKYNGLADVKVRLCPITDLPPRNGCKAGPAGSWFKTSPRESCLVWEDVGAFLIRDGHEIFYDPAPGADEGMIRQAVLGPAMGLLLQQHGRFPLHASAVDIAGRGVALAGHSGAGKSTLAAMLHARGHELITDDIAAIDPETDPPLAFPGFPRFRMWPESVKNFGESTETLPRLHSGTEKRLVALERGFAESPVPMKRVYVIDDGPSESIDPVPPQEGLLVLIRLCYNATLVQAAVGTESLMRQCARLADRIEIFRLRRRRRISGLTDLARMLEDHVAQGVVQGG